MAATATARRTTARATAAPRRAPRPAPRRAARPGPRLVPVAVGRTALAVGGIADSGVVLRLTRSRLWIGALGTLLVGIVALNVAALSFNASSSKTAAISDELRRENSALAADVSEVLSNERLQAAATKLGLIWPEPGAILYLDPRRGDAAAAAERLEKGEISIGSVYVPPPEPVAPVVTDTTVVDPAETTTDPAATEPVVPVEEATTTPDPAIAPAAGGIAAP